MSATDKKSASYLLEKYRVSLENAKSQPLIASALTEIGYDADKIEEGITLLTTANTQVLQKKVEDNESKEASQDFKEKRVLLHETYKDHKEKAKIILKNNEVLQDKLGINTPIKQAYYDWIVQVKLFYENAINDATILSEFTALNLTKEKLEFTLVLIQETEIARADYVREKGESQDATKQKNEALDQIKEWMNSFYRVAKLALKDHPQLLESLDKVVKN